MANQSLFPASVIGSMPRPDFVKDLISKDETSCNGEYERLMGHAIHASVALQESAGLDVISDGEWWRKSYIGVIAELAHGFEVSENPADGRPWTIVVDKLSPRKPGFIAKEVGFLKRLTGLDIKATLPSPALLGERMWDPERSLKAYPRRDDFIRDCVPILRNEVELLRDEGVHIVQIDDPHLCLFVDDKVRATYDDPDWAADFAVDMNNQVLDGIVDVKKAVHLCRRAGARARGEADHRGAFDPIMGQLCRLNVDHLTMEFVTPGSGEMSVLKQLPEHIEIGLGCVNCQPGVIDQVDVIVERVEQALKFISPERVTLNPDCGFAPGSAVAVGLDEVYAKLCNEVKAAQILRDKYG